MFKIKNKFALTFGLASTALMLAAPSYAAAEAIQVEVNQTTLREFDYRITKVAIANPEIADVVVIDDQTLNIVAKAAGTTTLNVWTADGMRQEFAVVVAATDTRLAALIQQAINMPGVQVEKIGDNVLLRGTVENQYEKELAEKIAYLYLKQDAYTVSEETSNRTIFSGGGESAASVNVNEKEEHMPGIINLLEMRNPDQINIEAMVIEINSDDAAKFGLTYASRKANDGDSVTVTQNADGTTSASSTSSGGVSLGDVGYFYAGESFGQQRDGNNSWLGRNWLFTHFSQINANIYASIEKGNARIISRPNITTMSGKTAGILVGGKIFMQTTNANGGTNVVDRNYGIELDLVKPTVDRQGNITTTLFTSVSRLDYTHMVSGYPSMTSRNATTVVNIPSGMTMVIGGLLNSEDAKSVQKVPLLSSIPILGELFKYHYDTNNKSEILILITPRVVNEHSPVRMSEKMHKLYDDHRRAEAKDDHVDVNDPPEPTEEEKKEMEKAAQNKREGKMLNLNESALVSTFTEDDEMAKASQTQASKPKDVVPPVPTDTVSDKKVAGATTVKPQQEAKGDSVMGRFLNRQVLK